MSDYLTIEEIHALATKIRGEAVKAVTHSVRCGIVMDKMKAQSIKISDSVPPLMESLVLLGMTHEERVVGFADTIVEFAKTFAEFGEAISLLGDDHVAIAEVVVEIVEKARESRQIQDAL